jgi:hypothetical protein
MNRSGPHALNFKVDGLETQEKSPCVLAAIAADTLHFRDPSFNVQRASQKLKLLRSRAQKTHARGCHFLIPPKCVDWTFDSVSALLHLLTRPTTRIPETDIDLRFENFNHFQWATVKRINAVVHASSLAPFSSADGM